MAEQIVVTDNPELERYEAVLDGHRAGVLTYLREPGRVTFTHTITDPAFEGRGVGSALVKRGLEDAAAAGDVVTPECWFVAGYIERHPEFRPLTH